MHGTELVEPPAARTRRLHMQNLQVHYNTPEILPSGHHYTVFVLHPSLTTFDTNCACTRHPGRMPLTGLRIGARVFLAAFNFVCLKPTVGTFVRAELSVVLAERSEGMSGGVLFGEVFCNLDLST